MDLVSTVSSPFFSETTSNNTVTKTYTIPSKASAIAIDVKCWSKHADSKIKVALTFNVSGYPSQTLCEIAGTNENQTGIVGFALHLGIPEEATAYTVTRTSEGNGNKGATAAISYLQ